METPSCTRMITRSHAAANAQKSKQEESHPRPTRNGGDRAALLDITNDSPVVGLAIGCLLTPSSSAVKSRVRAGRTPESGSGEEVLRGQVRTLLQKVEEEAELVNKPPFGLCHHHHPPPPPPSSFPALLDLSRSPLQLLAPTPANTPQVLSLNCLEGGGFVSMDVTPSPCVLSEGDPRKVAAVPNPEEPLALGPQECLINRALTFDSPDKSDMSGISTISSTLTFLCGSESSCQEKSPEDDNSSVWSIQVNASPNSDGDDDDELVQDLEEEVGEDMYYEETEAEEEGDEEEEEELLDDLCEVLKNMSVVGDKPRVPEFAGKHTRFIYNSDDEIQGEEQVMSRGAVVCANVLVLKGLPAPEGDAPSLPGGR